MSEEPVEQAAPPVETAGQVPSRSSDVLAVIGWITAVVFWPVGMVIGGILASRDDKRGRYILGVAVAMIVVWIVFYMVLLNAAEHEAVRRPYYEY